MQRGISTHLFLERRLSPGLLDKLMAAGASAVEVFAARHHFDYTDASAVREIANWFRANDVKATMHMPLYPDTAWSKHTAPTLNLISSSKAARIEAMDEVKRAMEAAEQVPFASCVLHLGMKDDKWDDRSLDDSMTAVEHLKAFAGPLGMKLLLENLVSDVATPANLVEIVRVGHFSTVGFCLDVGHANLDPAIPETSHAPGKSGVTQAFEIFGEKIVEIHLHDNGGVNGGMRDDHLWPGDGAVDWKEVAAKASELKVQPVGVLEIAHELDESGDVAPRTGKAWRAIAGE